MTTTVSNTSPAVSNGLAIIGEAPGKTEIEEGKPFVGPAGHLLNTVLLAAGLDRDRCFVGNVCQVLPPGGKIERLKWTDPAIVDGIAQLTADLASFKPKLCLLLGNTPLRALTGQPNKITSWRGTVWTAEHVVPGVRCLASYHPAAILRGKYGWLPVLRFDVGKAARLLAGAELVSPQRKVDIDLIFEQLLERLSVQRSDEKLISVDIEGGVSNLVCVGIAESPETSFIVPFSKPDHSRVWATEQEAQILKALKDLLEDSSVPKVFQNSLYDLFVLAYSYDIRVKGLVDDTMLKWWERYCELEKSLEFQASVLTNQPRWKGDRASKDAATLYTYCCTDAMVTYECNQAMEKLLPDKRHYRFNMSLLEPLLYMELKGIWYDVEEAAKQLTVLKKQSYETQDQVNQQASRVSTAVADCSKFREQDWLTYVGNTFGQHRSLFKIQDWQTAVDFAKDSARKSVKRLRSLVGSGLVEAAARGEATDILKLSLNTDAPAQMTRFLYTDCGYPKQFIKEGHSYTERLTAGATALLNLLKLRPEDQLIKSILQLRSLKSQLETLSAGADPDGRIRCGYNVVGSDTGRPSCYTSPTGSGFNLQTVQRKYRHLFKADEGYWFFQCDLSGADGWTVAAHCAKRGDPTMLDDLKAGIKPAKVLALMHMTHTHSNKASTWSREQLKEAATTVDSNGWLYFACKGVQHGSCYGMGPGKVSEKIMKDSYKMTGQPVYVEPVVCRQLQDLFFARYPGVKLWHAWVKRQLKEVGNLVSASGHRRYFFGRKDAAETLRAALSHEPQANTACATHKALLALWVSSKYYMVVEGEILDVQPLHIIHDALCGQFKRSQTQKSIWFIKQCFNNTLTIAGQQIMIPFEGGYGPSWGELTEGRF